MEFVYALKRNKTFIGSSGVSQNLIEQAQKVLGVHFSDEYIGYLTIVGIGAADGHEFTGISTSKRTHVVNVTIEERERNPLVPQNLYVIEQTYIDRIVVWQDETGCIYYTQPSRPPVKKYNSLMEYISQ